MAECPQGNIGCTNLSLHIFTPAVEWSLQGCWTLNLFGLCEGSVTWISPRHFQGDKNISDDTIGPEETVISDLLRML